MRQKGQRSRIRKEKSEFLGGAHFGEKITHPNRRSGIFWRFLIELSIPQDPGTLFLKFGYPLSPLYLLPRFTHQPSLLLSVLSSSHIL
jgi:hypothetical protein